MDNQEVTNSLQHSSGSGNIEQEQRNKSIPIIGMNFETFDESYEFYNAYARNKGFSVRKQRLGKNPISGLVTRREFCCNREGSYAKKLTPKKKRDSTRCGCNAMFEVKITTSNNVIVSRFIEEHNHELVPYTSAHLLRSQRKIDSSQKQLITTMHDSGLKQSQIFSYFSTQAGGAQNLNFIQSDCNNLIQKSKVDFLRKGDASCLNEYFRMKKKDDKMFFSAYRTNMENELIGFFYCDGKSRRDYAVFGDVVCFDTTFNTNKYKLLCAPIVGINNHGQTTLFGCGVIDGESEDGCMWLFNAFLEAMGGKKPVTIFTDQAPGIKSAIDKVFPESEHRLCLWHIYQNAGKNLSHIYGDSQAFSKDFKSCVYDPETLEEFESSWETLLDKYEGLRENEWLQRMYGLRDKWAQVYARRHFCAGVTTTQRSESINNMLKKYFGSKDLILREFVAQYDKAMMNRREKERIAQVMTRQTSANLISSWNVELEASKKYTRKIFNLFQAEIGKLVDLKSYLESSNEITMRYKVLNLTYNKVRIVSYNPSDKSISCTCRKFEFEGVLCSHSLKVMREELNLRNLSTQYYLKRWSSDILDEMVIDSYGDIAVGDHDPSYLVRYSELSHLSQRIVAKSSKDDQLYAFVKSEFTRIEENLKILKSNEEEPQMLIEEENLEDLPKDPKLTKSKGGARGRKKNALEIRPSKKKALSKNKDNNILTHLDEPSSNVNIQGARAQPDNIYANGGQVLPSPNYNPVVYPLQGLYEYRPGYQLPTNDSTYFYRPTFAYSQVAQQPNSHTIARQLHFQSESTSEVQNISPLFFNPPHI